MRLTPPHKDEPRFSIDTAAIGRIESFPFTVGHFDELAKSESDTSTAFMNSLISAVGKRPDTADLVYEDVARLSEVDRNEFARMFLDNNQYLFREKVFERSQDDDGDFVVSHREGAVKHERSKDESDSDYLFRLFKLQQAEMKEQTRRILAPLQDTLNLKTSLFTPSVLEALRQTQSATSQLGNMVDRMRLQFPDTSRLALRRSALGPSKSPDVHGSKLDVLDFPPIPTPTHDTNEKLSDVVNSLDSMESLAIRTAETVTSLDTLASQFFVAFSKASDKHERSSRRMTWLGRSGIVVAILISLGTVAYSEWRALRSQTNTAAAITTISDHTEAVAEAQRKSMGQIGADLNKGNTATTNSLDRLSTAIQDLTEFLRAQAIDPPGTGPSSSSG